MNTEQIAKPTFIPSLDGIRAIAVFVVLFSHAGLGSYIPGGIGVTIFFFLSGYLITTLLIKEYERSKKINVLHFFVRRCCRLFPPLIVSLLISYSLFYCDLLSGGVSLTGLMSQVFYLANYQEIFNWGGEVPDGTGVLWSLAVEEHFYLAFPLLFFLLIKSSSRFAVATVLMTICLMILCWRIFLVTFTEVSHARTYYASDTRFDSILFGCILALRFNPLTDSTITKLDAKSLVIIGAGVLVLLSTVVIRTPEFRETLRYSLQGLALMPIFYFAIRASEHNLFSWLNWAWLRKLGVYSYCIYLLHLVVIRSVQHTFNMNSILMLIIVSTTISIIFAVILDRYIDSYFLKLRKRFR